MNQNLAQMWQEVTELMRLHNRERLDIVAQLNRIIRKNPHLQGLEPLPVISKETTSFVVEEWSTLQLMGLLHPKHQTPLDPDSTEPPIIILRWRENDYLIDGRRRINYWLRTANSAAHTVIVIQSAD